jgi:histidine ammonia-lyase
MAENTAAIVGIEMLAAAQGIELRHPVTTSAKLQRVLTLLRQETQHWDQDRLMAPDIAAAKKLARNAVLREIVPLSAIG